jgi:hypothetical protein
MLTYKIITRHQTAVQPQHPSCMSSVRMVSGQNAAVQIISLCCIRPSPAVSRPSKIVI